MTVQVGVEGAAKGLDRAQLGKAIGQGLQRGITQVAIESAAQKAGVNPLTSALTSRAITGTIEGFLTSGPKVGDKASGVMKGIFDAYTNSTLNTLSLGNAPEAGNPYSQAVYASKVKDFSDIVRQRGLTQALETYATGIFTRDSLDAIVKQGGIRDMITGKAKVVPYDGNLSEYQGKNVKLIYTDKAKGEYFVTDLSGSAFIGEKKGNVYREGEFGVGPDGKFGLVRGWINETNSDGSVTKLSVTNLGGPEEIILPAEGISIDHLPEKKTIEYDVNGDLMNGIIQDVINGWQVFVRAGEAAEVTVTQGKNVTGEGGDFLKQNGLTIEDIEGAVVKLQADGKEIVTLPAVKKMDGSISILGEKVIEADTSSRVPENLMQALKTSEAKERILNYFQGFDYRSNEEISKHFESNANLVRTISKTGTIIFVRGRGIPASVIKTVTGGPINHTAILYIDNFGKRWVIQEKGPFPWNGLEKVRLDDWLEPRKRVGADINWGILSQDSQVEDDLKNSIERNLFFWNRDEYGNWTLTDQLKSLPYDTANLVGLKWGGEICSSLIARIYKDAGHSLFWPETFQPDNQRQYSPNDVYRRIKLIGDTN